MKKDNTERKLKKIALCAAVAIGIFWSFWPSLMCKVAGVEKPNEAGTFGDMFGGLNALFTGLTCVGLLYTILLQRAEINIARDEMEKRDLEQNFLKWLDTLKQHISVGSSEITDGGKKAEITMEEMYRVFKKYSYEDDQEYLNREILDHHYARQWVVKIRNALSKTEHEYPALNVFFGIAEEMITILGASPVQDKKLYTSLLKFHCSEAGLAFIFYKFSVNSKISFICHRNKLFFELTSDYFLDSSDKRHISNPRLLDELRRGNE